MSENKITTNHETIKNWAEERGGKPASVNQNGSDGEIKIKFDSENDFQPISWNEFFRKFEKSNLAMIYQETTSEGEASTFNEFVDRDTPHEEFVGEDDLDDEITEYR
jgi:hypothetical protein